MWVAKIQFDAKNTLLAAHAHEHGVNMAGYPLSWTKKRDHYIVHIVGSLFGPEKNKKAFLRSLKKHPRTLELEENKGFVVAIIREPANAGYLYSPEIIHISPAIISENGYEILYVGSFNRRAVVLAADSFKFIHNAKLISIQKKKISSLSIMRVSPELTDKQRGAMELAIKHGYYEVPRRVDVQDLAKFARLSFSTFQVHLRKAESKLIPHYFDQ